MSDGSKTAGEALGRVVADAMLRHPTMHPADLTVGQARTAFAASTKMHLLLLVRGGVLLGALTRDDLTAGGDDSETPALELATLAGRTVRCDVPLAAAQEAMGSAGVRRLAVVDADRRLLGLLCFKRSGSGFCSDEGVARMRAERA